MALYAPSGYWDIRADFVSKISVCFLLYARHSSQVTLIDLPNLMDSATEVVTVFMNQEVVAVHVVDEAGNGEMLWLLMSVPLLGSGIVAVAAKLPRSSNWMYAERCMMNSLIGSV